MDVRPGDRGELARVVTDADTAAALRSGSLPVLGTPRLLAWAEAATVRALAGRLGPGATSVGTRVELAHTAPSPLGARVTVRAEVSAVEGRRVVFAVEVVAEDGSAIGAGTLERVVVDEARFLARLPRA